MGDARPARCRMHTPDCAACLLSLRTWAQQRGLPAPQLDPAHEGWLLAEHARYAHRAMRLLRRVEAMEAERQSMPDVAEEPAQSSRSAEAATAAAAIGVATNTGEDRPARKRQRKKDKGFLAPGRGTAEAGMSSSERAVAHHLREALGVMDSTCPSLEELQARLPEVLNSLHAG